MYTAKIENIEKENKEGYARIKKQELTSTRAGKYLTFYLQRRV